MVNVYEMVTDEIIKQLEKGVIPWRKPWINANAVNWVTQNPYRGINTMLLQAGEYATFKQIQDAGGKVKKGEKGRLIVFWKWIEKENEEGEKEERPFLRYSKVFEINTQVTGLKSKRKTIELDHDPIEKAEEIVKKYPNHPTFTFQPGMAAYYPKLDKINCPPLKDFYKPEEYYSTMFHEMVHSTGHKNRLNRKGVQENEIFFGSETYSKEELIAEIGAFMLCNEAKIEQSTKENTMSYIQSWLKRIKEDDTKQLVVQAAAQAQKAIDHILGVTYEKKERNEINGRLENDTPSQFESNI